MTSRKLVAAAGAACALAVLAAGCGGSKKPSGNPLSGPKKDGCTVVDSPPPADSRSGKKPSKPLDAAKTYDVTMVTTCGSFTFRLDQEQSPNACASFVALVRKGFFDATIFHRIAVGFVIQGGDPSQSGNGGPGYTTVDTPPKNAVYTHGVVAMAKTAVDPAGTAGSQFFVVTAANAGLTPDYAIIGKVTKGLAVVDRIGRLGDASQQPTMTVEIVKATVTES